MEEIKQQTNSLCSHVHRWVCNQVISTLVLNRFYLLEKRGIMAVAKTIGDYLIEKLYAHGVRHVFGVPGDYALSFFHELESSAMQVINTCDEQGAGFAADAYARVKGLGAVCVTYCVGGLKVTNTNRSGFC